MYKTKKAFQRQVRLKITIHLYCINVLSIFIVVLPVLFYLDS